MTLAMERLAVIAAITLPITAIASVYGMNVIANDRTHVPHLIIVVLVMAGISLWLLRWARRQDGGDVVVTGLPRDLRKECQSPSVPDPP